MDIHDRLAGERDVEPDEAIGERRRRQGNGGAPGQAPGFRVEAECEVVTGKLLRFCLHALQGEATKAGDERGA